MIGSTKIGYQIIRRNHRKISYERQTYESVDDGNISYVISQEHTKQNNLRS